MNIVTLWIALREEVSRRAAAAFRGEEQGARISFDSVDLLWNTLTRKRWEILRAMTAQGALSIREGACPVGWDVKAVHGDVMALLQPASSIRRSRAWRFPMTPCTSISR